MIQANFKTYASYETDSLYQWDLNQVLSVSGLNLSVAPEVHFANANMDKAIVKQAELIDHKVKVQIPNSLLQEPLTIKAYIGIYEADTFKIIETVSIPVKPKARPKDYRIETTDEEIYSFEALKNAIANMVKSSDFETDKTMIQARIDNIIASASDTGDNAELIDMRLDADGTTHASAGKAVRTQINKLNSAFGFDNNVIDPRVATFTVENARNIFNASTAEVISGYYAGNGVLVDEPKFKTILLKLKPNTKYYTNFKPTLSLNLSYLDFEDNLIDHCSVGKYEVGTIPAYTDLRICKVAFCVNTEFDINTLIISENPIDDTADNTYYFEMPNFKATKENVEDVLQSEEITELLGLKKNYFSNKKLLIFGDSITETARVSEDGNTYTEGTRVNWPTFAKTILGIGEMWNYAKSGAHYKDDIGLSYYQWVSNQINTAIKNHTNADIIVISAGTNDANGNYGDYDTAIGKGTLNDLDKTKLYEAIRWAMWTLKKAYPTAVCFVTTPIQRADREVNETISNAIKEMAKRYNFIIIDAEIESGIISDNEIWEANGVYLVDGLHPNELGSKRLADLYCTAIINRVC